MDAQGGPRYVIVKVGDRTNGGIMHTQEGQPPNWLPYFVVAERDAACDRAKQLGGSGSRAWTCRRTVSPRCRIQGAAFAVWEGATDE